MLTPSQKHELFRILRWFYLAMDIVTEKLAGYSLVRGWKRDQMMRSKDPWSAHFVDVAGRSNAPLVFMCADPANMILRHSRYGDAREILANDKATLWISTADQAVFTVSQEDIYDTRSHPFAVVAQFNTARQLVIISHRTMHKLADEIEDKALVVIHYTARCGSTLLCQMFHQLPDTRVVSETWAFLKVHQLFKTGNMTRSELEVLTRSMAKMYMKSGTFQRVVLKITFFCSPMMPVIKSVFPSAHLIFNTRNIDDSMESWERTFMSRVPQDLMRLKQAVWLHSMSSPYLDEKCFKLEKQLVAKREILDNIYTLSLQYGGSFLTYLQNRDIYSHAVLYEDFVQDLEQGSKTLLTAINIPVSQVDMVLKGSKQDSQNSSFKGSSATRRISDERWIISDSLHEQIGSPVRKGMTTVQMRRLMA